MSSSSKPSKKELRASLVLPIVISLAVLIIGALLFQLFPETQFNSIFAVLLGAALIAFLLYWTRNANWQLRLLALLFALPALAGITTSIVQGRSRFIVIGVGATFLLLIIQRAFQVPASYRVASRYFEQGNYEQALRMVNKSIEAKPNFAESYQLRASIRMIYKQFAQAELDAKQAIAKQPQMENNYNMLGQIYLAEGNYERAFETFETAVSLDESNPMNQYHKGVSAFRLDSYQAAAEALSMSTKKTLPFIEYDLLAHYYLYQSLINIKRPTLAQTTLETMAKFADGTAKLEALAKDQADFEYILNLREDIAEIKQLLKEEERREGSTE